MCIRDRYQRRVRGANKPTMASAHSTSRSWAVLTLILAVTCSESTLESFLNFPNRARLLGCTNDTMSVVAWTETVAGQSNIFAATKTLQEDRFGPTFNVTAFRGDDGMVIENLAFGSNCSVAYFTRLGSNDANPTHDVNPPTSWIYAAGIGAGGAGMPPSKVGSGTLRAVASHPDDHQDRVYVAGAPATQNLGASLEGARVTELGEPFPVFILTVKHGSISSLAWSHDGRRMAFANDRGDHAFIGVYSRGQPKIEWLSPSFDADHGPVWSSDDSLLAWVRVRDTSDAAGTQSGSGFLDDKGGRNGPAYSMMVADMSQPSCSGPRRLCPERPVREVFRDWQYGYPDSGFGVKPIQFSADKATLVFGTEVSGHVHVVAVKVQGDIAAGTNVTTDLTPAECTAQDWVLAGDSLYVADNCDLVDSTGIGVVATTDPAHTRKNVVLGDAHHVSGMSEAGAGMVAVQGGLVYLATGFDTPASVVYQGSDATTQVLAGVAPSGPVDDVGYLPFNSSLFVQPELVTFPSTDGHYTIHAQVFRPSNSDANKSMPAVIFTHGGSERQMYAAMHYCSDYAGLYALNQWFASQGYLVLSVNYRSGVGYGRSFKNCELGAGCGWRGAAEYEDVTAGRLFLDNLTDSGRVGIHGLSYGGLNCLQALARDSDLFKAGACNAPVFNWVSSLKLIAEAPFQLSPLTNAGFRNLPVGPSPDLMSSDWSNHVRDNIKLAWDSSPAGHMENFTSPVLVLHGDSDANVDFQESVGLVRALRRKGGVHVETVVLPDERHGFQLFENQLLAAEKTFEFLQRFV
eukprot:TRINITY_DN19802_c0_g1_i1.p1 TRINITY_DN19802_c0_g1~~TRINITY_DN19802_c0_g1_i1.p1  ORF type:complete len:840 (+),score=100.20 TRINITY_DN19802_c0_g1_i1:121-2520(+)